MTAITTLLVDSYRLLKARVLFWITLGISALVAVMYLSIGFNDSGMSILFGAIKIENAQLARDSPLAELLYIGLFTKFIVPIWITWVAIVLGIISTASIFPDFMSEGSVELALSKPVTRLTVFVWKYIGGLLFMLIQVGLFALLVFLALRWRVGTWNPSVLWTVPLAVLVFSYLFAVVVFVNVMTRSALAGVLAALLVWFLSFLMNAVEGHLYTMAYVNGGAVDESMQEDLRPWHQRAVAAYAILPKTKQTIEFSDRLVRVRGETGFSTETFTELLSGGMLDRQSLEGTDEAMRRNSGWYVIGTSLVFEAVLLGAAAWVFCRRDF